MFEPTSRYYNIPSATYINNEGRSIIYKRRRFLPQPHTQPILTTVTVTQDDRLDLIAAKTLGNPVLFWRVADANAAMNPVTLTTHPGRILDVPIPQVPGSEP